MINICDMNKKLWFIPFLIVAFNALAIVIRWSSLPELLPAHFDLQGNAGGTMPRYLLAFYIPIGAAVSLIAYMLGCKKQKLQKGLLVLASGITLVLFSSSMVALTSGTVPFFMLSEPVILLAAVIGFIYFVKL